MRDAREMLILLRIEVSAVVQLLVRHHLVTIDELMNTVADEAELLDQAYAKQWPGCSSSDVGMVYTAEAAETMKGWLP